MFVKPFRISIGLVCLALLACFVASAGAQPNSLAPGILQALRSDELQRCKQVSGKFEERCHRSFVANLRWRELRVTPSGKTGILIENRNQGFCGSAGCALHLFLRQSDGTFAEVLDEVGALGSIAVLKAVTKNSYDLQKISSDRRTRTIYRWDGSMYSAE
jgi:hypothetical protein